MADASTVASVVSDTPTWFLVVSTLFTGVTPFLVGWLTIRHNKIEKEKASKAKEEYEASKSFRDSIFRELEDVKGGQERILESQRTCQLDLVKNYRTKEEAKVDWDRQHDWNRAIGERVAGTESTVQVLLPMLNSKV